MAASDPVVRAVITRMKWRSEAGQNKYGTTLEDNKLSRLQWLRHAQEEAMDLALYLEKLIREEVNTPRIDVIGQNGNDGEHYQELKPTPFQGRTTYRGDSYDQH